MKLFTIFSTLVTALAVTTFANPVPLTVTTLANPAPHTVEQRGLARASATPVYDDRPDYSAVAGALKSAHITPENGKSYWFTLEWDLRPKDAKDTSKMGVLRQNLRFRHIAVLVGRYDEIKSKNTPAKIERDFVGKYYHIVIADAKTDATEFTVADFSAERMKGRSIHGGKPTTKNNLNDLKAVGERYEADKNHKIWNAESNTCKTFTDYFQRHL